MSHLNSYNALITLQVRDRFSFCGDGGDVLQIIPCSTLSVLYSDWPSFFNKMYTTAPCFTCSLCDRPLFLISVESNTLLFTRIKSRFCTVGSPSYEFIIIAFYDAGAGLVAVNM